MSSFFKKFLEESTQILEVHFFNGPFLEVNAMWSVIFVPAEKTTAAEKGDVSSWTPREVWEHYKKHEKGRSNWTLEVNGENLAMMRKKLSLWVLSAARHGV